MLLDNPLLCDCQLQWYKNWLKTLKDKDDEMMQKKRTVCMMQHEHREYNLQNLPLEKMNCVIKSYESTRTSASTTAVSFSTPMALSVWVCAVRYI